MNPIHLTKTLRPLAAAVLLAFVSPALAGTLYWDGGTANITANGDGASSGGAGTWNTSILNWDAGTGLAHVAWDNANEDTAIFGGVAGVVSLGTGITVGGLRFTASGYALSGNTLTFGLAGTISNSALVTISNLISSAGSITKLGAGTLTLFGANNYAGSTFANAGVLDFGAISLSGFGGGSGRNISVASGASVRRNALDHAFLNRLVETTNEITVMTGGTANNLDFSSSTGANLPKAFLGNWAGNGAKTEYSGTLTPASDNYRLGGTGSSGLLGIVGSNKLTGAQGLIAGGTGGNGIRVELAAAQNFTGDTVIRSGAKLTLGHNLALQNSALDVGSAGGNFALSDGTLSGRITGSTASPSPTFGGLKGSRNLLSVFSTSAGNNEKLLAATNVTGFTLNVGTGKSFTYSGVITNFAPGTSLTKTGEGTQILTAANTFTGPLTVQAGLLAITRLAPVTNLIVTINTGAVLRLDAAVTNIITNLVLNGISQAFGVYNSNNAAPYLAGPGRLLVYDSDADDDGLPDSYEMANTTPPSATALTPSGDDDGDTLTNLQEYQWGTRANLADTDGDGLNDGAEVAGAGARPPTSPLLTDTDADGVSDAVETNTGTWGGDGNTGTNPAKWDTDGDGLRDGVESNTGIFVSAANTGSNPFAADTDADAAGDWYEVAAASTSPVNSVSKPNIPYPLPKPDSTPPATNKPVKVFILMGQSNMVGQGNVDPTNTPGTLATIVKQQSKFPNLLDTNGNWSSRNDVTYKGVVAATAAGPLTVGQGSGAGVIGPELGFGHVMGYYFNEPVLVLKTSEGGKDLGYQLLPPGSQRYTNAGYVYAGYGDSPRKWLAGSTPIPDGTQGGEQYDKTVAAAKGVLSNFNTLYTNYATQGYEIAGFGWFQGWNDIVGESVYPGRYETNMANYIKKVRADFNATNAPFVIAASGFSGTNASGNALTVITAQLAMNNTNMYPEFTGNVKTVDTRAYWRELAGSPADQGYHYNRNSETFMLVGDALGRGMIDLLGASPVTIISYGPLSGSSFPLTFSGTSGQAYQVLRSSNLALPMAGWSVLSQGTFGASPVTFTDTTATNTQQFYRIQSP